MKYPTIREIQTEGGRVFLRADLNVPLRSGKIADDTRIRMVIPTLRHLLDRGFSVIIASHLGRPKGIVNPELSLAPVTERLSRLLGRKVLLAPDCTGKRVETMVSAMKSGDVILLENLRFHSGEEECDPGFVENLASLADIYVNDAFGTCHRNHSSMSGIPLVKGGGYIGFLVEDELKAFDRILSFPEKPFTLLLGGAKVSDKIPVIRNLLGRIDNLLIGGGMAFTFMKALDMEIGTSILESDSIDTAADIIEETGKMGIRLVLPSDVVVAHSPTEGAFAQMVSADEIPPDQSGLDIGQETTEEFGGIIRNSRIIIWNGPMGLFEVPPFDRATRVVASAIVETTSSGATSVIGGGDTVRAVSESGLINRFTFVSTGGGASLLLLQGKELPALAALGGSK